MEIHLVHKVTFQNRVIKLTAYLEDGTGVDLAHCSVIWIVKYTDDRHKYRMSNNRDHQVGRLTEVNLLLESQIYLGFFWL